MRFALILVGLLMLPQAPAFAQEASASETRCWVGNITFSAGMAISAGDGTAVCKAGSGWTKAEAATPVAGCLLEGKLSSAGAIVGIRNNDSLLLQCDAGGRWVTIDTAAQS
ncbi:hypothetical protein [uncultured Devosia sp.]|uniref:hypothetical protein n=1 Tax=uncultured Devosia sp. TaxID=211434 RepID=UPI0035C9CB3F